jgi:hypothetical protein
MATQHEFANVISWLTITIGKPIADGVGELAERERKARMSAYYDCLGDLPPQVLMLAAKRVALSHPWATFPSVAELREAAVEIMAGPSGAPTFAEAWQLSLEASKRMCTSTDPNYRVIRGGVTMSPMEFNQKILAALPPLVAQALQGFGSRAVHEDDVCRSQFRRMYEELAEKEYHRRLLPDSLAKAIDAIGNDQTPRKLPETVKSIAGKIGMAS